MVDKAEKIVLWSYVMSQAKKQGDLRTVGKFTEADELEKDLKELIYSADKLVIDVDMT